MNPKVSIVTLTFNQETFISDYIESVLNQTCPNWEMIIIDDGSTDGTQDIIQRYQDSRIVFIEKDHRGIDYLGEKHNYALQISKGELISVLEGDDCIPSKRLEVQKSAFKNKQVVLSHGKYAYVFDDRVVVYPNPSELKS